MKSAWLNLASRIDALTLRERVFLFVSMLATLMALADVFWLSPAQQAHRLVQQRSEKLGTELARVTALVQAAGATPRTDAATQAQLADLTAQLQRVNQSIEPLLPEASDTAPLVQAMVHLLRRHEGLTLLQTKTVSPEAAGVTGARPATATTQPAASGLTRQGVELSVAGPYAELIRYVQSLEKSLPQARWGTLRIHSDKALPELTVRLYLLELTP